MDAHSVSIEVGDARNEAGSLRGLGLIAEVLGDLTEAEHFFKEALGINKKTIDLWGQMSTMQKLGVNSMNQGKLDEAKQWFQECLNLKNQMNIKLVSDEFFEEMD